VVLFAGDHPPFVLSCLMSATRHPRLYDILYIYINDILEKYTAILLFLRFHGYAVRGKGV